MRGDPQPLSIYDIKPGQKLHLKHGFSPDFIVEAVHHQRDLISVLWYDGRIILRDTFTVECLAIPVEPEQDKKASGTSAEEIPY